MNSSNAHSAGRALPWQLKLFSKGLKKRQKLALLRRQMGGVAGKRCLLITNGDNNGALNYRLREAGGCWTWVENEGDHIAEMEQLLGDPVHAGTAKRIPLQSECFDVVISVDVHEHLDDCRPFNAELRRVAAPGAIVIVTTPNGDPCKPAVILKRLLGMTPEKYGHRVIGYPIAEHEAMLKAAGLEPVGSGSYSKFFTESIELALNLAFVTVLGRKRGVEARRGEIAPVRTAQMDALKWEYMLYASAFPLLWLLSQLDWLCLPFTGYAVSVIARRPP